MAVRTFVAEYGDHYNYKKLKGKLSKPSLYRQLGFNSKDLSGSYFYQKDYKLKDVTADPQGCVVEVESSHPEGPPGKGTFDADGNWSVVN